MRHPQRHRGKDGAQTSARHTLRNTFSPLGNFAPLSSRPRSLPLCLALARPLPLASPLPRRRSPSAAMGGSGKRDAAAATVKEERKPDIGTKRAKIAFKRGSIRLIRLKNFMYALASAAAPASFLRLPPWPRCRWKCDGAPAARERGEAPSPFRSPLPRAEHPETLTAALRPLPPCTAAHATLQHLQRDGAGARAQPERHCRP